LVAKLIKFAKFTYIFHKTAIIITDASLDCQTIKQYNT